MNQAFSLHGKNITQKCCLHAHGEHLPMLETRDFVLTETKHHGNISVGKHSHATANLVTVLNGSFTERIGRKSFDCTAQNILLKPPEEIHSTHYNQPGAHCLIIEVQAGKLNSFLPGIFDEVKHLQATENFNLIRRIYRELRTHDDVSKIAIEGLTLELLANFTRETRRKIESQTPRWLLEAKEYIHANFNNPISLSVIAQAVDIHPSHLARVFRAQFRCSIGDYIRRLRLDYAAKQLTQTEKTFADIAATAGFYDHSHFANAFKNHTGQTPGEYRAAKE